MRQDGDWGPGQCRYKNRQKGGRTKASLVSRPAEERVLHGKMGPGPRGDNLGPSLRRAAGQMLGGRHSLTITAPLAANPLHHPTRPSPLPCFTPSHRPISDVPSSGSEFVPFHWPGVLFSPSILHFLFLKTTSPLRAGAKTASFSFSFPRPSQSVFL